MKHLQPREYYEDIYDLATVQQCRSMRDSTLSVTETDIEDTDLSTEQKASMKDVKGVWVDLVKEMTVFFAAAERFNKKESAISKMMTHDKTKDHLLENATVPDVARCRKCHSKSLKTTSKDLWHDDKGEYSRVLFMLKCLSCNTNSAFYNNGEEWVVEPTKCPNCNGEKLSFSKNLIGDMLTLKYDCHRCDNAWEEVHDFTIEEKEPEPQDLTYHEDRKLYCYSKKVRSWAEDLKNRPLISSSTQSWEVSETERLYKEELAKIEIQTVAQVNKRLGVLLSKNGYSDFALGTPNFEKQLEVTFTAIDSNDSRTPEQSQSVIWKSISKELQTTNWRMVRTSLSYRSGYVRGKLKAYENKLELEKLVDDNLRKSKTVKK